MNKFLISLLMMLAIGCTTTTGTDELIGTCWVGGPYMLKVVEEGEKDDTDKYVVKIMAMNTGRQVYLLVPKAGLRADTKTALHVKCPKDF